MRLWSIHPCYLDAKGLVALWRESLLAQQVLLKKTTGYRNHPQLQRFKSTDDPVGAVAQYLHAVADEAEIRSYRFDRSKIRRKKMQMVIDVTEEQISYEFAHLLAKLRKRDPVSFKKNRRIHTILPHPLFQIKPGEIEPWEKI